MEKILIRKFLWEDKKIRSSYGTVDIRDVNRDWGLGQKQLVDRVQLCTKPEKTIKKTNERVWAKT